MFAFHKSPENNMKFNVVGLASAFVFLAAVSVVRLGQQPTFNTAEDEARWSATVDAEVKKAQESTKRRIRALDV